MIEIKDVTIAYENCSVLNDFSLSVNRDEVIVLTGNSGCGKTTILRMIMGLVTPVSGNIIRQEDLKISVVFQENRLCDYLSALKNVMMVLDKDQKHIAMDHLSRLLKKEDMKKPVRTYSGGMKRRVSIARAFAYPSDLILLDEPFTGLDVKTKQEVIQYMKQYRNHRTIILVTHDLNDAKAMNADRIIQL